MPRSAQPLRIYDRHEESFSSCIRSRAALSPCADPLADSFPRPPARTVPGTVPGVLQRLAFWSLIAILACATGTISVAHPAATALTVTALVSCGAWLNNREKTRLQALAAARSGESICGFARSFDLRSTDPLVVRAVYARLQSEATPQAAALH